MDTGEMVGRNSWSVGRIGGIEVRIDPSWSFIAVLIAYSFYLAIDVGFETMGATAQVVLASLMAVVFFASVLLHELAHSWVAVSRGVEVESITLFLFGGATKADLETGGPTDELLISVVGPLTSLALAGAFWLMAVVAGGGTVGGFVGGQLGWINLALAVFNLVPGFPLDGGRVLRSVVWRRTGDIVRATRIAARGGQLVGYGLIVVGIAEIVFLGALVGGLWLMAIGWFLAQAAQASFSQMQMRRVLSEVTARQVMSDGLVEVPGEMTVARAVDEYFMRYDVNAFPVRVRGETTGLISMSKVRQIPREDWPTRTVGTAAEPLSESCTVSSTETLDRVVGKLMSGDVGRVVVMDEGRVVGIITPRDLSRWLQRSQDLGLTEPARL